MIKINTLKSSSKGNCYLIRSENLNILLDIGINKKELEEKLSSFSLTIEQIDYLFVSHIHGDHFGGISNITKNTKVIAKGECLELIKRDYPYISISGDNELYTLYQLSHDAENYALKLYIDNKIITYITDTGYVPEKYVLPFSDSDLIIIEANHSEKMLLNGKYPIFLKQRIIGDSGHLSNRQVGIFLNKVINPKMLVLLVHLSEENNTKEVSRKEISQYIDISNVYFFDDGEIVL